MAQPGANGAQMAQLLRHLLFAARASVSRSCEIAPIEKQRKWRIGAPFL
jgi:hypothetical protein